MPTSNLRKVGGSIMVAIPPSILEQLDLRAGATVALEVEDERLIIEPRRKPRFTLDELLAECEPSEGRANEDQDWLASPPVGRELL
jgi:antitoxin ChpS